MTREHERSAQDYSVIVKIRPAFQFKVLHCACPPNERPALFTSARSQVKDEYSDLAYDCCCPPKPCEYAKDKAALSPIPFLEEIGIDVGERESQDHSTIVMEVEKLYACIFGKEKNFFVTEGMHHEETCEPCGGAFWCARKSLNLISTSGEALGICPTTANGLAVFVPVVLVVEWKVETRGVAVKPKKYLIPGKMVRGAKKDADKP